MTGPRCQYPACTYSGVRAADGTWCFVHAPDSTAPTTPTAPIVPAWDLIGHEGQFRTVGGRRTYEAVMYDEASARGDNVRLCYLATDGAGVRQVNRWVDPDTPIEVIEDYYYDDDREESC